jgi:hypothetical protein
MEVLWLMVVALGPVLLGVLIAYVMLRRRRLGPATRKAQKRETERLYEEEPRGGAPSRGH